MNMEESNVLIEPEWLEHEGEQTDNILSNREIEIEANRARIASDMPKCINTFLGIEKILQVKEQKLGEWMQIVFEINQDFENAPSEVADEIGNAFLQIKWRNGIDIAQLLYDTQVIVLPNELTASADYLSKGGQFDSLQGLASVGFFMEQFESSMHDDVMQVVSYMNDGGAADKVYQVLAPQENKSAKQQELGMT